MTTPTTRILVVEDDPQMRRFLRATLRGFAVVEATSGREALSLASSWNPEVVLLDLGLPDLDGREVLRQLRGWSSVPVIVVSARGQEAEKVAALDAGADDYLTKPYGTDELLARLRVALRHASRASQGPDEPAHAIGTSIVVDLAKRSVTRAGAEVHLTPNEFRLLATLVKNRGRVLTHRQLLKEVWGPEAVEHTNYLRVYMAQLRQKLENDPSRSEWLLTETGVGYRLREDPGDT